jgi:hypothetical protein
MVQLYSPPVSAAVSNPVSGSKSLKDIAERSRQQTDERERGAMISVK